MTSGGIEIRSYRVVFDLERRIHRVDRWRLPFPYGLPLRSIAYALVALAAVLCLSHIPLLHQLVALLPSPARIVLVPVGVAYALTRLQPDGRSAHVAARAWIVHQLRPRRLAAWRRVPALGRGHRLGDATIAPGAGAVRVGIGTVRGPATVVLFSRASVVRRGRSLVVRQAAAVDGSAPTRISFGATRRVVLR